MQETRFDQLTKSLASSDTVLRRDFFRRGLVIAGSVVGIELIKNQSVRAQSGPDCCPTDYPDLCDLTCTDQYNDPSNCGGCGITCDAGQSCCAGTCVATDTDFYNCGTCGNTCSSGNGLCCDGACIDRSTDPNNCSDCGHVCRSTEVCENNACVCAPGFTWCWDVSEDYCVDLVNGPRRCGNCSNTVSEGELCCGGLSVWPANDVYNCGGCGNTCAVNNLCCNGTCVDHYTDENNCGNCGIACPSGYTCCNQSCIDLSLDNNDHCGACGNYCNVHSYCASGVCQPCPGGTIRCGGSTCVNPDTCP